MILLRKWWAPIRARLIDDAGRWWRFWSMRFAILGALLESFVRWFPDQVREVDGPDKGAEIGNGVHIRDFWE